MAKVYNIVDVIGRSQFTYQLYNNLAPEVEGTSSVTCNLEASGGAMWVSRSQSFEGYYVFGGNLFAYTVDPDTTDTLIYSTDDLGITWTLENTITGSGFSAGIIRFVEVSGTLYVFMDFDVGDTIYRTSTDGINFTGELSSISERFVPSFVYFNSNWYGSLDPNSAGTVVRLFGQNPSAVDFYSGRTDVKVYSSGGRANNPLIYNGNLYYLNSKYSGSFYMVTSDGTSWSEVPITPIASWPNSLSRKQADVYNSTITYVNSAGSILQTTDLETWNLLDVSNAGSISVSFCISTGSALFAYQPNSSLYYLEEA